MLRSKLDLSLPATSRLRRPFAVTALCAVFLATAPAGHARSVSDADATGDLVSFYDAGYEPAPEEAVTDVAGTRLTHSARRVAVRVEYAELRKIRGVTQMMFFTAVTNEGVRRYVELVASPRNWSGETLMLNAGDREIRCRVRHLIDYQADVMRVSFPRRCIGNPRWVRFRVAAFRGGPDLLYLDDALRDRPLADDDKGLAISGRVYREAGSATGSRQSW